MSTTGTTTPAGATYSGSSVPATSNPNQVGWTPGQPLLYAEWGMPSSAPKRDLQVSVQILPELDEGHTRTRPLWQRPAFIVSMALTLVTVGVGVALLLGGVFGGGPARVSDLAGELGTDNLRLTWTGSSVPYGLYAVSGSSGPAVDLTQLVRGNEAWIPVHGQLFDDATCFVVRDLAGFATTKITVDAATLNEQGAQRICVADLQ